MQKLEIEIDDEPGHQHQVSNKDLIKSIGPLGISAFGGPLAHIALLKEMFVDKNKWVLESEFTELFGLCQSLPGPTSTQLVIAIGVLAKKSWIGGLFAFGLFAIPSALVMLIGGLIIQATPESDFQKSEQVISLLAGFQMAAIAIVGQAAYKFAQGGIKNRFHFCLWFIGCFIYILWPKTETMVILLFLGALINLSYNYYLKYRQRQFIQQEENSQQYNQCQSPYDSIINHGDPLLGMNSIYIYVICFALFSLLAFIFKYKLFIVAQSFIKIGSLIIGGGHVVLPMILTEFEGTGWITAEQFWNGIKAINLIGFSLVSCMPGPMFNISIYVGAVIGGIPCALAAWIALNLPAILIIWGLLPYWKKYRNQFIIKGLLEGMSLIAIGFVAAAQLLLFQVSAKTNSILNILALGCLCFYFLEFKKVAAPLIIIGGGISQILIYNLILKQIQ